MSDVLSELENNNEDKKDISSFVKVIIAEDKMSVMINLSLIENAEDYTVDDIIELLQSKGIKQGISSQKIKEALANFKSLENVIVANGKMLRDGEDGRFIYHFRTVMPVTPKLLSDGSVDFKNMDLFEIVTEGQLIAEYVPATAGEFGFSVFGELLTPKRGKDLTIIRGKGFTMSEDRKQYFASVSGIIKLEGEQHIVVEDIYVIEKNVDTLTGNIKFDGDVHVRGDVKSGYTIEATGNVVVEGHVEAASIIAGKSILLKKGSQGSGSGCLQAGEMVAGMFFESVSIRAKQKINANYLFNCDVFTEDMIVVAGKRGVIIGGQTKANKGIICYGLGNVAEIPTTVHVGIMQEQMDAYQDLGKRITKVRSEVELFEGGLFKVSLVKVRTDKINSMNEKLLQARDIKQRELDELMASQNELLVIIKESSNAKVDIKGAVYPGVIIYIDERQYKNAEAFSSVVFYRKGNEVVATTGE